MYTSSRFLDEADKVLKRTSDPKTVTEAREVERAEKESQLYRRTIQRTRTNLDRISRASLASLTGDPSYILQHDHQLVSLASDLQADFGVDSQRIGAEAYVAFLKHQQAFQENLDRRKDDIDLSTDPPSTRD